jgi:hypothetical protein
LAYLLSRIKRDVLDSNESELRHKFSARIESGEFPDSIQRHAGNQAIQSLLRSRLLRAKLTIGNVDDPAEREADRISNGIAGVTASGRLRPPVNHKQEPLFHSLPRQTLADIPGIVERVLHSPGRPLEPDTRASFESLLGFDLGHVRVHTDGEAADSARTINAQAYTVGREIAFAEGRYAPHTNEGKRLLAHELVHTVQQASRASSIVRRSPDLGDLSIHVVNGKTFAPIAGATVHIDQSGVSGPKSIDLFTDRNGDTPGISLEEGNYTVTVSFWCCDMKVINMHVDGNTLNFLTAEMKNCDCRISSQDADRNNTVASSDSTADGSA